MPQPKLVGPFRVCPHSGRVIGVRWQGLFWRVLFPLVGAAALLWHLLRVVPKPSRATYPCQRVAAPLAWTFIAYVLSFPAMALAANRARRFFGQARYGLALACASVALVCGLYAMRAESSAGTPADFRPPDPPNSPIGVARGIHPGRVVWVRDPSATRWNGSTGHWWDPAASDQARVDAMLSQSVRALAGAKDDATAWNALFRYHNRTQGRGDAGYARGQQIAVKINQNTARDGHAENGNPGNPNSINGNPHLTLALLRQLVHKAGVAPEDIILYDISRYFPDNIAAPCHAEFPAVHFVEVDKGGGNGREAVPPEREWARDAVTYKDPGRGLGRSLPPFLVRADYLINMAIMKNHGDVGPTLLAKNHFGTVHGLNHGAIAPKGYGESNPLVDLMAHQDVGEKTLLFMIDTLYAADGPDATPRKWRLEPFGTPDAPGWPASLFVSQDGVAIESVGFDFVWAEWGVDPYTDNMLREAALANSPPSGKPYGPVSLGVHEHWNNPRDKAYSRNLGRAAGIELMPVFFPEAPRAVVVKPGNGWVALGWAASPAATAYHVQRAARAEGPYQTLTRLAGTGVKDANVANGQCYYYTVSTVNALGESAPTRAVSASPGAFVAAINAGGGAVAQFAADGSFRGGQLSSTEDAIDTLGVAGAAPESVYQTDRWGHDFDYTLDGLRVGGAYRLRLHFAEFFFREPGKRVFNVTVNGAPVLTTFDVLAAAGARNKAVVREFPATADAAGRITVAFTAVSDNPKVSGVEILETTPR